jgi:hypothetical protein
MSEDPKLFDAGDYNLFRYCHNDPIDFTDPLGLETNFWVSLVPVVGEASLARDSWRESNYGMFVFHAAMAISDVSLAKSGVVALGKTGIKLTGKLAARPAIRAGEHATERKALVGYRYVGNAEAKEIRRTGEIPMVDAERRAKNVFFTNERFTTGVEARDALSLKNMPQFRVEFNLNQARAGYGGLTEGGHAEFTLREGAQPIRSDRMLRLDDAESLDQASRHTPPKLDQ